MKNLKKKLICNIYEFMGIEEVQYGSRELFFRNIIKEIYVPGKIVDVQHHAGEAVGAVPLRVGLPLRVPLLQGFRALLGKGVKLFAQLGKHGVVMVQLQVQPAQLVQVPGQAGLKPGFFRFGHGVHLVHLHSC